MFEHPVSAPTDVASYAADGNEAFGDLAWWVTGGVSLLAWTGIALLLTGA